MHLSKPKPCYIVWNEAAAGIGLHVNAHKTGYMCFNQTGDISTLNGSSLKLVEKFTYLGSSVSSTETDIDTRLAKAWAAIDDLLIAIDRLSTTDRLSTAIDRLPVIWKSDLTDKMKRSFFSAAVVSIDTAIWMHYKDANKTWGENASQQQHKNTASNIEQVLETASQKVAAVRPPTTHHENYQN